MNNEESRLRTFSTWPSDAAVDSIRIAKAGFFHTGQGMEVQCFACGGKISEWDYGDQVMARHRRLDPNCPFVVNPSTSGNVPKLSVSNPSAVPSPVSTPTQPPSTSAQSENQDSESLNYLTERSRLATYENWPVAHIVRPEELAEAGFYFTRHADRVKCAYCNGCVGYWEAGDDPKVEHRRHFPHCSFVTANFNLNQAGDSNQMSANGNSKLINRNNLQELGIQAHRGPKQPRYATIESRLRSFTFWSEDLIQTPAMLAEAGFYYVGTGDQVRCFHCDGGLRHWDPEDEPWVEHAKWFPACAFVRLLKGQEFIQSCTLDQQTENNTTTISSSTRPVSSRQSNGSTPFDNELTDTDIQAHMISTPALIALGLGLHEGRVKQAILYKIQQTGTGFTSADELIEEVLNVQIEETDMLSNEETVEDVSSIMSSVSLQENKTKQAPEPAVVETKKLTEKNLSNQVTKKLSLEEENRQLKEARLCKICMDNEIGVVFLPCGHLTTCVNCAPSLKDCPVCRCIIKGTVRTFLS